jgi:hypothetical protein
MQSRAAAAVAQSVPFINYGVLLAQLQGSLRRAVAIFPHLAPLLEE